MNTTAAPARVARPSAEPPSREMPSTLEHVLDQIEMEITSPPPPAPRTPAAPQTTRQKYD